MKVSVDRDRCTGHGRCYMLAPDVYGADDEGYCVIPEERIAAAQREVARRAALNCPEDAITILNDEE